MWIATDKNCEVYAFEYKPTRYRVIWAEGGDEFLLPEFICIKLIGKVPTWSDEPIELK